MIDPKSFFREMDSILATIRIDQTEGDFLVYIISELEHRFGPRLNIKDGRIYEQRGSDFVLVMPEDEAGRRRYRTIVPLKSEAIQLIARNRSYIYDNPAFNKTFLNPELPETEIAAALWVHSPDQQWLLVFKMAHIWEREEISLFLNSVRIALNYRIFSDKLKDSMEQAAQIQRSLLPEKPPVFAGYDIFSRSKSAEFVGGDFYDYFQLEEGTLGISMGDASGHGLPAALLVRDVVIGLRMGLTKELRVAHTLQKLNQVIQRSTYSTNYVSLFVGEIEKDGHLFYMNAGHPPPFVVNGETISDLAATGITLGFLPEIDLHRSYIHLEKHSVLVLYSDGIIERESEDNEQFGIERLKKLVQDNVHLSARDLTALIFQTVFDFGYRINWEDDATIVVIKRVNGDQQPA
ncbi:MAG TPA: PP2C family protein-serine/threonine phosphatase [bacterium]|nr:PP2C family protein-serine/threonine phosphatase [bacterium]HPN44656.1 PP2C family protein-serine/threonine phosphatase [bacterium]